MLKRCILAFSISAFNALPSVAEEQIEPRAMYAMCAAANAILSTQMESGMLADVIKAEARRHSTLAMKSGATQQDLKQFVEGMGAAYNQGKMTWDQISSFGETCSTI